MSRIFFATICLIVYGSLYPWHFQAQQLPGNPIWILAQSWPDGFNSTVVVKDIVVNLVLYAPLGLFGVLSLAHKRQRAVRLGAPIAAGFALSCGMEMLQLFVVGRVTSALDVVSNTAGAAIGVLCGVLFESYVQRIQTGLQTIRYRQASSLLLLICFTAYRLFPFFPDYRLRNIHYKLIALMAGGEFSALVFLTALIEWLAVARLVETAIDPEWASRIYPALLTLVPARILIAGHSTTCAELGGAALAYFVWRYGLARSSRRSQIVAALFTALIVLRGLAPFQFASAAGSFSWIPFLGFFDTEWVSGISILLGKLFTYGTFVWLLRDSGCRMPYAAIGAAATLAAIEAAQIYLPNHVAEITDPLLALLLAWILWLADDLQSNSSERVTIKMR